MHVLWMVDTWSSHLLGVKGGGIHKKNDINEIKENVQFDAL